MLIHTGVFLTNTSYKATYGRFLFYNLSNNTCTFIIWNKKTTEKPMENITGKPTEKKSINQSTELVLPEKEYDEIVVAIVGNVDSGKSTTCGILSHPKLREFLNPGKQPENQPGYLTNLPQVLDDGNGAARSRVLTLQHERESGRTSSISYNYMVFDAIKPHPRIVSLVDLAGHEQYLKTTITGVISSYPEHGLVLISKTITQMTREHYAILASMGIPVLFVLTKIDIIPEHIIQENIKKIATLAKRYGKTIMHINTSANIDACLSRGATKDTENKSENKSVKTITKNNDKKVASFGYIKISNKSGEGLPLLIEYISKIRRKKNKNLSKGFAVDHIYRNIPGFGLVVSGITGIAINKGDSLFLGPFKGNEFAPVKIRSIHNDYRHFVDVLESGVRGCLCVRIDDKYKKYIRMGMSICRLRADINSVKTFHAHVAVFRGKSANIKVGFNSYINVGLVRGGIIFKKFMNPQTKEILPGLITAKDGPTYTLVELEFMNDHNVISIGDRFLFRSGRTQGIGKIVAS